jgi:SpoVK/Ycf46/Vps4 family AAA+-type ATPase
MSMYYGQSEKVLSQIFDACEGLGNSILFIDEIDSLATKRGTDMHEATRRILSVLLRRIEGFEKKSSVIVIGATNRKADLDEVNGKESIAKMKEKPWNGDVGND